MFIETAYAQEAAGQAAAAPTGIEQFIPFIAIFVIFWFFIIRPQSKKMRTHQQFVTGMKVGDQVLTNSGIFGTIKGITEQFVTLEVADDVRIRVLKSYVSSSADINNKKEDKK